MGERRLLDDGSGLQKVETLMVLGTEKQSFRLPLTRDTKGGGT